MDKIVPHSHDALGLVRRQLETRVLRGSLKESPPRVPNELSQLSIDTGTDLAGLALSLEDLPGNALELLLEHLELLGRHQVLAFLATSIRGHQKLETHHEA